jgi:hypothetical protein
MRYGRTLAAVVALGVGLAAATFLLKSSATTRIPAGGGKLSVDETVGAMFLGPGETLPFLKAANPAARERLHQLLLHDTIKEYHSNILLALGYIGNADDVAFLERRLQNHYNRNLDGYDSASLRSCLVALALLTRAGVPGASDALDRVLSREFWAADTVIYLGAVEPPYSNADEIRMWAHLYYPLSGKADWRVRVAAFRGSLGGKAREAAEWRVSDKTLADVAKEFVEAEGRPMRGDLRPVLLKLFNGDFASPGRAQPY